jgi:hypothetical protein
MHVADRARIAFLQPVRAGTGALKSEQEKIMKHATLAAALCLCALVAFAGSASQPAATRPAEKLVFPNNGFAISPLDEAGGGSNVVLMMFLPPSGGLAPNVNVIREVYSGALEEYINASHSQLEARGLTVISVTRKSERSAVFEYTGPMEGRDLHWYAKVAQGKGTVHVSTATASAEQWQGVSGKLKACVDSLEPLHPAEWSK